jgi:hypothetical protein
MTQRRPHRQANIPDITLAGHGIRLAPDDQLRRLRLVVTLAGWIACHNRTVSKECLRFTSMYSP